MTGCAKVWFIWSISILGIEHFEIWPNNLHNNSWTIWLVNTFITFILRTKTVIVTCCAHWIGTCFYNPQNYSEKTHQNDKTTVQPIKPTNQILFKSCIQKGLGEIWTHSAVVPGVCSSVHWPIACPSFRVEKRTQEWQRPGPKVCPDCYLNKWTYPVKWKPPSP